MKYFVTGMIVGLILILLGDRGAFGAFFAPGFAGMNGASGTGGQGAGVSAGAVGAPGVPGGSAPGSGGCGCGCSGSSSAAAVTVPAPAIPINQTPSSPWSGGFSGNPNYESPQYQILPASKPIINPSTQGY